MGQVQRKCFWLGKINSKSNDKQLSQVAPSTGSTKETRITLTERKGSVNDGAQIKNEAHMAYTQLSL